MVFSTIKMLSDAVKSARVPDQENRYNLRVYGYPWKHVKHHYCLAPLHFCTILGSIVATCYIVRMLYIRDCVLFSWRNTKPVKQNENITLFAGAIDYKSRDPAPFYPQYEK